VQAGEKRLVGFWKEKKLLHQQGNAGAKSRERVRKIEVNVEQHVRNDKKKKFEEREMMKKKLKQAVAEEESQKERKKSCDK